MKKLFLINLGLSTTAVLVTTPARAQSAESFTGVHADVTLGLDQLRFDLEQVGGTGRAKNGDLGYSLSVGYDGLLGPNLIGGVEVATGLSDNHIVGDSSDLRERRELSVAGRLGTTITPNTLLYGKVGYANLQLRTGEVRSDVDGILLGAGVEAQLNPKLYVKGEYRYTDYANGFVANNIMTGVGIRF